MIMARALEVFSHYMGIIYNIIIMHNIITMNIEPTTTVQDCEMKT